MSERTPTTLDVLAAYSAFMAVEFGESRSENRDRFYAWLDMIQEDARVAGYLEGYEAGWDDCFEVESQ